MNTPPTAKPRRVRPKPPVILPTVPSKLIRLALRDLRKCESMPEKYQIDMGTWFKTNGHCTICLAGAVLAQRLNGERWCSQFGDMLFTGGRAIMLDHLPDANKKQLRALDYFRTYHEQCCAIELLEVTTSVKPRRITPYVDNPAGFHRDMSRLASDFAREGN